MGILTKNRKFLLIFLLIVALGSFLRLYQLDLKPLHHDEGEEVFLFIDKLLNGQALVWDYDNKGLFQHFLSFPLIKIFGYSTITLRLTPAILGCLTIVLLYFFRNYLGRAGVLASSFLLAVSPFFVYYSRHYTTYPFIVFFTLLFLLFGLKYAEKGKARYLYLLFADLAILLNIILEATLIFLFVIIAFFYLGCLFSGDFKNFCKSKFRQLFLGSFLHLLLSFLLFLFLFVLIQSSFFLNFNNLSGLLHSFGSFSNKSFNTGHNKGVFYFLNYIIYFESGFAFFSFVAAFIFKRTNFLKFLVFWSGAFLLIFSLIPYKTNWTLIFVMLPLVLLAADGVSFLARNAAGRKLTFRLLIAAIGLLGFFGLCLTVDQNFIHVNDLTENKIGYVETTSDVYRLINDINAYRENNPGEEMKILVCAGSYWPLPIYLKDQTIWYLGNVNELKPEDYPEYKVFIIDRDQLKQDYPDFTLDNYALRSNYNLTVLYKK